MANILLVEDHHATRRALSLVLCSGGHTVLEVPDGYRAVQKARDWRPDVVVTDLRMPGLGGLETIRRISSFAAPACIIVTGASPPSTERRTLLEECDELIEKPVDPAYLLAVIGRLLGSMSSRRCPSRSRPPE